MSFIQSVHALNQEDATRVDVTGPMIFVLLLAIALAFPVSFYLIRRYRGAVSRSMRSDANPRAPAPPPVPAPPVAAASPTGPAPPFPEIAILDRDASIPTGPEASALYESMRRATRQAAAVYVVAGACYALTMALLFLKATGSDMLPLQILLLSLVFAWPIVLTVNVVAATNWRRRLATAAVYFLIFAAASAVGVAIAPELTFVKVIVLWLAENLPSTVLLLAFLTRRIRAVGPLVLIFMVLTVTGSQLTISLAGSSDQMLRSIVAFSSGMGLGHKSILFGLVVLGFLLLWPVGWLTLRLVRRLYEKKKISDQTITVDAIWLLFGVVISIQLALNGLRWIVSGLVAFIVFKAVAWAGFSLLNRQRGAQRDNTKLLLLRVFSLRKRSAMLFGALGTHWRRAGSIQLIVGRDLVIDTLEPHEFLDFVSGKLARRFIDGPQTLDLRLSEMDNSPDQDGRFRVNDFFCHNDAWRAVLSRLVGERDVVVLMDLRSFSKKNAGCLFEINELINTVPLERIVFIVDEKTDEMEKKADEIDKKTDEEFLLHTVRQSWEQMRPSSPNRLATSAQLRLFRYGGSDKRELGSLLRTLCVAAKTA